MPAFYNTLEEDIRAEADHTFTGCVLCGGPLSHFSEQNDGVCFMCHHDAPMTIEVTPDGFTAYAMGKHSTTADRN